MPEEDRARVTPEARPATGGSDAARPPKPLSARDLQEQASEEPLEVEPGSDADQANEVPHVG